MKLLQIRLSNLVKRFKKFYDPNDTSFLRLDKTDSLPTIQSLLRKNHPKDEKSHLHKILKMVHWFRGSWQKIEKNSRILERESLRLNMELDLKSLFGIHVQCAHFKSTKSSLIFLLTV
jgi:hypothetical protein